MLDCKTGTAPFPKAKAKSFVLVKWVKAVSSDVCCRRHASAVWCKAGAVSHKVGALQITQMLAQSKLFLLHQR